MVQVKVTYTLEKYKDFYRFALFPSRFNRFGQRLLPFVSVLAFSTFLYSILIEWDWLFSYLVGLLSFLCLAFYAIAALKPRWYAKKAPVVFQAVNEYVFGEQDFEITQTGALSNSAGTIKYEALHKAYETKTAFYLYLTNRQAFLLPKEDFLTGTPDELRRLLETNLPKKKFVRCK